MSRKMRLSPAAAVVAAAGLSTRMGREKLSAELGGEPVLLRTLEAFEACREIEEVILCAREDQLSEVFSSVKRWNLTKVKTIVPGGATRQESVKNGFDAVAPGTELLCIHDGARPFVTPRLIVRVLEAAALYGAAAAAVAVKNTIKQADREGFVCSTPDRSTLWEVQTPQCFRTSVYRAALQNAPSDCTDDCMLVEAAGGQVKLVQGDLRNIKLTTPEDLLTAQIFWETRE